METNQANLQNAFHGHFISKMWPRVVHILAIIDEWLENLLSAVWKTQLLPPPEKMT